MMIVHVTHHDSPSVHIWIEKLVISINTVNLAINNDVVTSHFDGGDLWPQLFFQ